jgi:hypothetical protein
MNNQFDELDGLEQELGDTLRVALRRVAATVTDDSPQRQQPPLISEPFTSTDREVLTMIELDSPTGRDQQRNRGRLVAAGILAAAAVAGIALVLSRDDGGTPTDEPIPTVTVAAAPTSEHVLDDLARTIPPPPAGVVPVEVTLTLPAGWEGGSGLVQKEMGSSGNWAYVGINADEEVAKVYSDPCHHRGTVKEAGPTVEDLAVALEQQPTRDATVADIEIDGFAGKLVRMSVPTDIDFADCDDGQFRSWVGRYHQGPGQRDDVYILDVDGDRTVIGVSYFPDFSPADMDEIQSVVQSIRISSPVASEAPTTTG